MSCFVTADIFNHSIILWELFNSNILYITLNRLLQKNVHLTSDPSRESINLLL